MEQRLAAIESELSEIKFLLSALVKALTQEEGEQDPVEGLAQTLERLSQEVAQQSSAVLRVDGSVTGLRHQVGALSREHA